MYLKWLKKVGWQAKHNAFVDLCEFNQLFYCVYREAKNHLSDDGNICILSVNKQGEVVRRERIALPKCDLRDPKITQTPTGTLLLTAYARPSAEVVKGRRSENLCWFSTDGQSWSTVKKFAHSGWWVWRLRWHNELAYGFAYNKRQQALNFYAGDPRRSFFLHQEQALSLAKDNKGYPNESDLFFNGNQAYAVVRRDADSYSAQLGHSHAPFKRWKWIDLGRYLGGPTMLPLNQHYALVGARIVKNNQLVTALLKMHLETGELQELMILPSAGDNSYPGMVLRGSTLFFSYYSSHIDNKSCVYFASIDLSSIFKL